MNRLLAMTAALGAAGVLGAAGRGSSAVSCLGSSMGVKVTCVEIGTIKTAADVMMQCKAQNNATFVAP